MEQDKAHMLLRIFCAAGPMITGVVQREGIVEADLSVLFTHLSNHISLGKPKDRPIVSEIEAFLTVLENLYYINVL